MHHPNRTRSFTLWWLLILMMRACFSFPPFKHWNFRGKHCGCCAWQRVTMMDWESNAKKKCIKPPNYSDLKNASSKTMPPSKIIRRNDGKFPMSCKPFKRRWSRKTRPFPGTNRWFYWRLTSWESRGILITLILTWEFNNSFRVPRPIYWCQSKPGSWDRKLTQSSNSFLSFPGSIYCCHW